MPSENAEIATLLRETADLLEIEGENPFRIRAYRTAARVVEEHPESIAAIAARDPKALTELPGIGKDLAQKIAQLAHGRSFDVLREARKRMPPGLPELMRLPGLGPKRAQQLHRALKIRNLRDLERALKAGRLRSVPGFGERTEQRLLTELGAQKATSRRFLRARAAESAERLVSYLRDLEGLHAVEVAGSYRRCVETVGDLDILVTAESDAAVIERFVSFPGVARVLAKGPTRASVRLRSGLQVDLRLLAEESFGSGLYYFTGSKAHNIAVRRLALKRGLKVNEYGIFRGEKRIGGRTEEEVFRAVDLPWIPPELREDRGEIEAARANKLPGLLELGDIRGDLQCHTTASDGRNSLEQMAETAEALGYTYLAVTDHTPALAMIQGLDRQGFRRQMKEIERLNGRLRKLTVLAAAEVDILADGTLDLDDDTMADLDLVVASIHSRFGLPEAQQTERVVRALRHPSVDILGHPAGRIIGRRRPLPLAWDRVFETARDHGVMIEVNAQPDRLDLDDRLVQVAIGQGVRLVVSTDAHSTNELSFMRWGVDQARRGWAEKKDVANTLTLRDFRKLLHGNRN